jgi:hypothetical protein
MGWHDGAGDMMDNRRIAALRARVPRAFARPLHERIRLWTLWSAGFALTGYCLWRFDFAPQRLVSGAGDLGVIVRQLFPPAIGDAPGEILWALLETVAMRFSAPSSPRLSRCRSRSSRPKIPFASGCRALASGA